MLTFQTRIAEVLTQASTWLRRSTVRTRTWISPVFEAVGNNLARRGGCQLMECACAIEEQQVKRGEKERQTWKIGTTIKEALTISPMHLLTQTHHRIHQLPFIKH